MQFYANYRHQRIAQAIGLIETNSTNTQDERLTDDLLYWLRAEYEYIKDQAKDYPALVLPTDLELSIDRNLHEKW
jgi:hypothetical protein